MLSYKLREKSCNNFDKKFHYVLYQVFTSSMKENSIIRWLRYNFCFYKLIFFLISVLEKYFIYF